MRPDGFCKLSDILSLRQFAVYSIEEVEREVQNNPKKRYTLIEVGGEAWIRATQGHTIRTINEELLCHPIRDPQEIPMCLHGTYYRFLDAILASGLCRMSRNHIHFMPGEPRSGAVVSGMRGSCEVLIYVEVPKAMAAGIRFFRSDNNVILSPGAGQLGIITPEYFTKVVDISSGRHAAVAAAVHLNGEVEIDYS
eukprot:gene9433-11172_t